jgi:hypothetical protein
VDKSYIFILTFAKNKVSFKAEQKAKIQPLESPHRGLQLWQNASIDTATVPSGRKCKASIDKVQISEKNGVFWDVTPCGSCKN